MSSEKRVTKHEVHSSIRDLIEQFLLALILAFVARAFLVEPFIIPTGSMAPTLLGQHFHNVCPQCGYEFQVDHDARMVNCPMCRVIIPQPVDKDTNAADSGDRILVLKYIHSLANPKRFDPIVFKNPQDPTVNYIKRLIGLPGETIRIVGGNIYIAPPHDEDTKPQFDIARKPMGTQQVLWRQVYHSQYLPLDLGLPDPDGKTRRKQWTPPWVPSGITSSQWGPRTEGLLHTRIYQYQGNEPGRLIFNFDEYNDGANRYVYNQSGLSTTDAIYYGYNMIEDMRLGATRLPGYVPKFISLTISTYTHYVQVVFHADGKVILQTTPREEGIIDRLDQLVDINAYLANSNWTVRKEIQRTPTPETHLDELELVHLDQAFYVKRNNQILIEYKYPEEPGSADLYQSLDQRAKLEALYASDRDRDKQPRPFVRIEVSDGPTKLRDLYLDRDIYYLQSTQRGFGNSDQPATLNQDEFYCLGDNSPQSQDSREWTNVDPWVQHYIGKDQPVPEGIVPRDLIIGRAFYVYWPAAYGKNSRIGVPALPNFSRMRLIR